jgi:hypothetical protein
MHHRQVDVVVPTVQHLMGIRQTGTAAQAR